MFESPETPDTTEAPDEPLEGGDEGGGDEGGGGEGGGQEEGGQEGGEAGEL